MSEQQRHTIYQGPKRPDPKPGERSPAKEPGKTSAAQDHSIPAGRLPGPKQFAGEKNGPRGPEPTRYGDWEKGGRCTDF